jgi:hypothetical protein
VRQACDQLERREEHVGERVVLPFAAVHGRADAGRGGVERGLDDRADDAEAVEPLGAAPLRERGVTVQQLDRGDVVRAAVAEHVGGGVGHLDASGTPSDHDRELALVGDAADFARRHRHGVAMAG